jgi:hypothetical protein
MTGNAFLASKKVTPHWKAWLVLSSSLENRTNANDVASYHFLNTDIDVRIAVALRDLTDREQINSFGVLCL